MMQGHVSSLHALLSIPFRIDGQPNLAIEFVVDTGFTGFLTLPIAAVAKLQLPFVEKINANLATDQEVELSVYAATIVWKGFEQEVRVLATGRRPLLGTALLDGSDFRSQFVEGGLVTIEDV